MQHQTGQSSRLGAEYQIAEPWPAARSDLPLLLNVRVRNTGAIAWPDDSRRPINLSYHWLDQRGRIVDYEGVRATLPGSLPSGDSVELELPVEPPPRAGSYLLQLDMVEEHVGWFSHQGVAPLAMPIEVAPAPLGRPRVCIVNGNCLLNDAIGNHVINQLRFFLARGYDALVLVEEANPRQPAELRRHIFQITLDELGAGPDNPQTRRAVRHFLDADLYVFNYSTYYRLAEAIEMVDHGVILFDYHGVTPAQFWDGPGLDVLIEGQRKLGLVRYADYAIAHSGYARDELLAAGGISPERVSVLPYAVPLARFRPGPRDPALAARYGLHDRLVLLYVGRMAGNKRIIDL
ncbi:MAG TPA: glycosyltransferase, partial [Roseiflexaceae bacterium]|nr:glycosyltransferase [Roseiflexaceae bacterium]